ncbi:MAG: PIN domain-containing protein [Thermoanaerobaculia bacterium]|nr:PIN domain-containing protein [Thermoanaerobaculia bacterium]
MRIYLDLCCLKRPFDGQGQILVRLQTEAIANILALPNRVAELIRAPAQALENSFNQMTARRNAVDSWLAEAALVSLRDEEMESRINELREIGFKSFDAFHLASAELANADVFLTVDCLS